MSNFFCNLDFDTPSFFSFFSFSSYQVDKEAFFPYQVDKEADRSPGELTLTRGASLP